MSMVTQVIEFNQKILGIQPRALNTLSPAEKELSIKCLKEETKEFEDATLLDDPVDMLDAVLDSIYFAIGIAYKMGLTPKQIEACFTAIHQANMTKQRGVKDTRVVDGAPADAVKPKGWIPPEARIATALGLRHNSQHKKEV